MGTPTYQEFAALLLCRTLDTLEPLPLGEKRGGRAKEMVFSAFLFSAGVMDFESEMI